MAWITTQDVANYLSVELEQLDEQQLAYLESATGAAIDLARDRRQAAGYKNDDPDTVPSERVKHACVLLAGAEFRQQGAIDGFPSYTDMSAGSTPAGTWGTVVKYLGIPRPAVA